MTRGADSAGENNLAGCCGIYCGLCPRYQSKAKSRCPGCKMLSLTISCKIYNCCAKQMGFVTCARCDGFPCERFEKFYDFDSFVTRAAGRANLARIAEIGLRRWLGEQSKRRALLEELLAKYNDGRSASFYCLAAALLPVGSIKELLSVAHCAIAGRHVAESDMKAKANIVRAAIQEKASAGRIELRLRKKTKKGNGLL